MSASSSRWGNQHHGIDFKSWVAIDQAKARQLARDPETGPLWLRMVLLGIAESGVGGHAGFAQGELAKLVAGHHRVTGELHRPSSQQLSNAIGSAINRGFLELDSGLRCLRPHLDLFQKGGKRSTSCLVHLQYQ